MRKNDRSNIDLYYMELPQADYLNDIEIQDEHVNSDYNDIHGLSDEQVTKLTHDSLNLSHKRRRGRANTGPSDTPARQKHA